MPAVQKVREAANRATCGNNLKQLALAAHNYHSMHMSLPPGYLGVMNASSNWNNRSIGGAQNVGVFPFLLPYIEQDNVYTQLRVDFNLTASGASWTGNANNTTMAQSRFKVLWCPSDDLYGPVATGTFAYSLWQINGECSVLAAYYAATGTLAHTLGRTNYAAVNGSRGEAALGGTFPDSTWSRWEGIFNNRTRLALNDGYTQRWRIRQPLGR